MASMNISDFFEENQIVMDGEFRTLGYVDSSISGTLAYGDTACHLKIASMNKNISCIITREDMANYVSGEKGFIFSIQPRNTFYKLHNRLMQSEGYGLQIDSGIGHNCVIHPSAIVSEKTKIGNNVTILENVVIKDGVTIGDNTFIDTGAVIGCDGLLYYFEGERPVFIRHAGGVSIGCNVTILSGAMIVKSVHESFLTVIGNNSIIGISTNIGHEARIGNNCVFSSNCVVARRAQIGNGVFLGPSSVIREHVRIEENAWVRLGSVVIQSVGSGESVSGNFAMNHQLNLRHFVNQQRKRKI